MSSLKTEKVYDLDYLRVRMFHFLAQEELYRSKASARRQKVKERVQNKFLEGRRESFGDLETIADKEASEDPFFQEYVSQEQFYGRLASMYAGILQAEAAYEQTCCLRNSNTSCAE